MLSTHKYISPIKFVRLNVKWPLIYALTALFVIVCIYLYFTEAGLADRTRAIVIFDTIPILISLFALSLLSNERFGVEKFFMIFWTAFQLGIFTFWIMINFDFSNSNYGQSVILSLALVYLCHIFMTLGLIILTIAMRRNQLIDETKQHKVLERSLNIALKKAQYASGEKDAFLKNMSYELRNPLNAILGFSESLKLDFYGDLNDKQMEYIENIHGGGVFLLKLITDLLHLSNIEEGKVEISPENINLLLLLNNATPLLQEIVSDTEKGIKIINDIDESKRRSASVFIDQIRVMQILINLVSNAVKYGNKNAPIIVKIIEADDDYYRITVTDEGIGIPIDHFQNIFAPFHRAGQNNSAVEGVGVGLSIAKQLIEDMNGKIGFVSEVGKGSSFWIDMPISDQRTLPIG